MLRSFRIGRLRDANSILRIGLGVLLLANLVAAGLVLFPPGGSAEDLDRQQIALRSQMTARSAALAMAREHAAAVEKGRSEGDDFLSKYFLPNRAAFSSLLNTLQEAANQTKIKQRDGSYAIEPIEGSDSLSMYSITAAYEGTYPDLMHFVHEIDRSRNLLILESLSATPQQSGDILTVSMKLNTFVRDDVGQGGGGQ
jgi:hypothetical protein